MRTLHELFAKYGIDTKEQAALLEDVENFVHESVTAASGGTISKAQYDKLLKQRSELNTQAAEHEHEIAELKTQLEQANSSLSEMKTIKTEYEQFKQKQIEQLKSKWETAKSKIDVQEDNPQFEKINRIKGRFKLDAESEQDIKRNLEAFELLEETGFFGETKTDIHDKHPKNKEIPLWKDPLKI